MPNIDYLIARLKEVDEPFVVMGVGIPGSGKTTALEEVATNLMVRLVSPDNIRKELTGYAGDQFASGEAWTEAHLRSKQELGAGHSVIIDATHAKVKRRRNAIEQFRIWGANKVIAAVFEVPIDVAKQHNSVRSPEYKVPDDFIDTTYIALLARPPSTAEGFNEVIQVQQ